nr:CbiX/SirB N-terminal domain-containing protein [Nigerium massiliense]
MSDGPGVPGASRKTGVPLVIAAHGTRVEPGADECLRTVARVQRMLPDVDVRAGFVELTDPPIADALADVLARSADKQAVVVPLMLGSGGHVKSDIPEAITAGRLRVPGSAVVYGRHLGPDPRLRRVLVERAREAAAEWPLAETSAVILGRGTSLAQTNADHARLARLITEEAGFARAHLAFIQVTHPTLGEGLDEAYGAGARRIVVVPNYLFAGKLQNWTREQTAAWSQAHPDADVRIAGLIGDCDELATVVVERYHEALGRLQPGHGSPAYLAGLMLAGREVLVVGGGTVADRRVPILLEAGARVRLVAPEVTEGLAELAARGEIAWERRTFAGDLGQPWYVLALTDSPATNAEVARLAADARVFCVRGDDATGGTARTPAVGTVGGLTVGVLGDRTPQRSARARDAAVKAVGELD